MRISLPRRPGSLGTVATALGALDADINLVEIVEKGPHTEIDEFILDLPAAQTIEALVAACDSLEGVEVQWIRNYPRGGGIESDLELFRRMNADSCRAAEMLASASPIVFRAQWGVVLDVSGTPRVTFGTPGAPALDEEILGRFGPFDRTHRVTLENGWLPGWDDHHAVVAPMPEHRAVAVGRCGEPAFFASELARLDYLVGATRGSVDSAEIALPVNSLVKHRQALAAPLYSRNSGS